MAVTTTKTNKPLNPRGNDQSPKGYNRAEIFSGKALDFDGVNDYVESAEQITGLTTGLTFLGHVYIDSLSAAKNRIFTQWDGSKGWFLVTNGTDKNPFFRVNTSNGSVDIITDTAPLKVGEWMHIACTYNGAQMAFYIDGQLIDTAAQTGNITTPTSQKFRVGINESLGQPFDGKITGTKVFDVALTQAQILDLYNNPEKIVPTGVADSALKLWLPMQEGAGTTAYDGSGNGNHGTISGATWQHGVGAPVAQTAVIDWNKGHNYIDKSEEFETAYWTENRLVTITDDSFIAPDGSATATEIVESTANDTHFLAQTLSVTAGDYFISIFAKKRDYDFFQLSTGGDVSRYSNYNLTTGTLGNSSGFTNRFIEDYGNGWFRVGGKITTSATSFNYFPTLIQSDVASRFDTYTGTNKGVYIWGAQATKSATLLPYLRNIGTSAITSDVLLPQGLTTGRDITGVNLFENVRKQGALNLDGKSWAEVHDNASLDVSEFTLEGWIYTNSITSDNRILSKWFSGYPNRTFQFSATNDDLYLYISDGSSANNTFVLNVLSLNNWYHCVATYDGANLKIYLDGVLQSTTASTMTLKDSNEPVYIGAYVGGLDPSDNTTAQPRIYNRALTAEEVQRNYNAGKNIYK